MSNQLVSISGTNVPVIKYRNQRVITFGMMDDVHQRPTGTANRNFNANRKHFFKGEDFFFVKQTNAETRILIDLIGFSQLPPRGLFLFTKTGYLKTVKSFTTSPQITSSVCSKYFGDKSVLFLRTQSFENEFGEFLTQALTGITSVATQVAIQTYRVDFLLPEYKIVIEYDEEHHHKINQLTKDDEHMETLILLGYVVVRINKYESYGVAINRIIKMLLSSKKE